MKVIKPMKVVKLMKVVKFMIVKSSSTDNTLSKHPLPQLDRAAPPEVSLPFAATCC